MGRGEEGWVLIGVVGAPKGVGGAVRITTYTGEPAAVAAYGPVYAGPGGRALKLTVKEKARRGVVVTIEGVEDRNAAEALRGTKLYVPRTALPEPQEDEYYYCELIGLRVETSDGRALGEVRALYNFGAGDIVEVARGRGRATVMLPFTRAVVPVVDIAGRRLVVAPPPGLIDEVSR